MFYANNFGVDPINVEFRSKNVLEFVKWLCFFFQYYRGKFSALKLFLKFSTSAFCSSMQRWKVFTFPLDLYHFVRYSRTECLHIHMRIQSKPVCTWGHVIVIIIKACVLEYFMFPTWPKFSLKLKKSYSRKEESSRNVESKTSEIAENDSKPLAHCQVPRFDHSTEWST